MMNPHTFERLKALEVENKELRHHIEVTEAWTLRCKQRTEEDFVHLRGLLDEARQQLAEVRLDAELFRELPSSVQKVLRAARRIGERARATRLAVRYAMKGLRHAWA